MISVKPTNSLLRTFLAVGGICLGMSLFVTGAKADQWDKKTVLTITEPMQVTHTVLEPGQYVFKLLDSQSDRHIVQIFNADQTQIIDTQLAIPNYRLQPTGHSRFAFWETPAGRVKALRAWFYPGDNFGQEFSYPKQLAYAELSTAAVTVHREPEVVTAQSFIEAPAAAYKEDVAVAVPDSASAAPAPQEPVLMAQNTPPPAPASMDSSQTTAARDATPTSLPKTGSYVPAFGFAGLLSLTALGLLRRRSFVGRN